MSLQETQAEIERLTEEHDFTNVSMLRNADVDAPALTTEDEAAHVLHTLQKALELSKKNLRFVDDYKDPPRPEHADR